MPGELRCGNGGWQRNPWSSSYIRLTLRDVRMTGASACLVVNSRYDPKTYSYQTGSVFPRSDLDQTDILNWRRLVETQPMRNDSSNSQVSGRIVLAVTILGSSMAFIDGTVVNVVLPALQNAFQACIAG